jgi:hypothetical protein
MLVYFGRQAKKRDTQKTMNFVHLQKGRRNTMRLIDADALKNALIECTPYAIDPVYRNTNSNIDMFTAMEILDELPTIDAMPVVRCKDCKHYNTIGCSKGFGWCENIDRGTSDNFYCANGKQLKRELEAPLEEEL